MYYKATKAFLSSFPKSYLLEMFKRLKVSDNQTKKNIISKLTSFKTKDKDGNLVPLQTYYHVCAHCKATYSLFKKAEERASFKFCGMCGKTSPFYAFYNNINRTNQLMAIARMDIRGTNSDIRSVLLEQSLVTVITSIEILLRETYALFYDLDHVIFGKSIFYETYTKSRNEFLNLGNANSKIKAISGIDLKNTVGADNFKFIGTMYSARHVIIHNCSIRDKEYLSQTGEPIEELNKQITISLSNLEELLAIAGKIAKILDSGLKLKLLENHRQFLKLKLELSNSVPKKV